MSQSNVTQFPARSDDEPRDMMRFAEGYLESVFYGDRWRRLADILDKYKECIGSDAHRLVRRIMARKKRPEVYEIGTLIGLLTSIRAQEWYFERSRSGGGSNNVVPLKRKAGSRDRL